MKIDPILEEVKPDTFLVLGDTNSCLCAIAVKRRHIPIFHMEAGNRCFDQRVPEETNRKIVDHTSDINLTYSDIAREYLLREGLPADSIIKTGSPMFEVLNSRKDDIEKSDVLERLGLEEGKYFVISAHREENINSEVHFLDLVESLNAIAEKYKMPIIISTHPRTRKMIEAKGIEFNSLIQTMKPLGFNDYNKLQFNSKAVLSDSGTISEESSILGFKALNVRQQATRNADAFTVAKKALDCVIDYFITNQQTFASQKWSECNDAISHACALMYEQTNEEKYINAAEYIANTEWKLEYLDFYSKKVIIPDWLDSTLNGTVFGRSNQPRWETLYTLATLGSLYKTTGNEKYYKALDSLWWGMVGYDRHNIGSFGTGEGATGNPYGNMSETCNTVAWSALSTEYLKLTKNSYVADELEMSYYNAIQGSLNGDNRVFSYANNSNGTRDSATVTLQGHSYINAPDMSCCQASGTRGLSSITEWAVLTDKTEYPRCGHIRIKVDSENKEEFNLNLRIPMWSNRTKVKLNGKEVDNIRGYYCTLTNKWDNDIIEIELDMSLHFWIAEKTSGIGNKVSIYYGPLLLGAEESDIVRKTMKLDYNLLKDATIKPSKNGFVEVEAITTIGKDITLKDYAQLGKNNESYFTWLTVSDHNLEAKVFSKENMPQWCVRDYSKY